VALIANLSRSPIEGKSGQLENLKPKILNAFGILELETATLTVFRLKSEMLLKARDKFLEL
jgi:hypothetical protein